MSIRRLLSMTSLLVAGLGWAGGARAQSADEIHRNWSLGNDAFDAGTNCAADPSCSKDEQASDWQTAADEFRTVLTEDPNDVDAYVRLAQCQERIGEDPDKTDDMYHANETLLAQALAVAPDSAIVKWQLGVVLWGRSEKAPLYLQEALATRPDLYDAAVLLGHYYFEKGQGSDAAAAYEDYLKYRPDSLAGQDTSMRLSLSSAYLMADQDDKAVAVLEQLQKDDPKSLAVAIALGSAYAKAGECDKGAPVLEGIVDQAQEHHEIVFDLSTCYLENGNSLAALKIARQYVNLEPDDAQGHMLLGDIFRHALDNNSALGEYERAYRLDVGNKNVGLRLAQEYRDARMPDRSVTVMERLTLAHPEDLDLQEGLATAYVAVGRISDALAIALKVITAAPDDANAQAFEGEVYYAAGKLDDSVTWFQKSLDTQPGLTRGIDGLREALAARAQDTLIATKTKDPDDKAEQDLLLAQSFDLNNPFINLDLAIYYLDRGIPDLAAKDLDLVIEKHPDSFFLNYALYRTALALKKDKEAGAYLETALAAVVNRKDKVTGQPLAIAANELGALYVKAGKVQNAIVLFQAAVDDAQTPDLKKVAGANLAIARESVGVAELDDATKSGKTDVLNKAMIDLENATSDLTVLTDAQSKEYRCMLAVAYLQAGPTKAQDALDLVQAVGKCPLASPYDKAGTDFLIALGDLEKGDIRTDLPDLQAGLTLADKILASPVEPVATILKKIVSPDDALMGYQQYTDGKDQTSGAALLRAADKYRDPAEKYPALDNDLAVLDYLGGNHGKAESAWSTLGGDPAVALLNLGIAKDADGDALAAYSLYQKASAAKVPVPSEWTEYKRRIFGGEIH
jgi:tetratricopeptide (TPR) repeat protein